MLYIEELTKAMTWIGEQSNTYFLGQAVEFPGTAMYNTLINVPINKKRELGVCEDMQIGMSIGLALNGFIPLNIIPRMNFLLLAINQLINHLDKIPLISDYRPKVIIRSSIGSENPMFPNYQHIGDFTDGIKRMCSTLEVIRLDKAEMIVESYQRAYDRNDGKSTLLIEWADKLND